MLISDIHPPFTPNPPQTENYFTKAEMKTASEFQGLASMPTNM